MAVPSTRRRPRGSRLAGRLVAALLGMVLAAALGGCVEYRERIELGRDGSGSALLEIGVSENLARAAALAEANGFEPGRVRAALAGLAGIEVVETRVALEQGTRWLRIRLRFASLAALAGLDRAPGYQGLFGRVALAEGGERKLLYRRTVSLDAARFGATASLLLGPLLARYPWRFEVAFPTRVAAATGPGAQLADGRRLVRWGLSLDEVIERPHTLEARYARPGPGLLGLAAAVALMVAVAAGVVLLRRSRRRGARGAPRGA